MTERIKAALADLEQYIDHEYKYRNDYPSEMRRYNRDMETVHAAREELSRMREVKPCPVCGGTKLTSNNKEPTRIVACKCKDGEVIA